MFSRFLLSEWCLVTLGESSNLTEYFHCNGNHTALLGSDHRWKLFPNSIAGVVFSLHFSLPLGLQVESRKVSERKNLFFFFSIQRYISRHWNEEKVEMSVQLKTLFFLSRQGEKETLKSEISLLFFMSGENFSLSSPVCVYTRTSGFPLIFQIPDNPGRVSSYCRLNGYKGNPKLCRKKVK